MRRLTLGFVLMMVTSRLSSECDASNQRDPIPPLPAAQYAHATAVLEDRIYVIGSGRLDVFDPKTNKWTSKSKPLTERFFPAAVALDGKIFVIGGLVAKEKHECPSAIERYDPKLDKWEKVADLPTCRSRLSAVVLAGKIWVLGGFRGKAGDTDKVEIYDPVKENWTDGPALPKAVHGHDAAVLDNTIYVLAPDDKTWALVDGKWKDRAPAPSSRLFSASGILGGKLYSIGGRDGNGKGTWEYDPAKDKWTEKKPMTIARNRFAAAAVHGHLYALGGEDNRGRPLADVERYDPVKDQWDK